MSNVATRAQAYLAKLPEAVSGQSGHAATYHAACKLVEFGLEEAEAFTILADWNRTHCKPPWGERDLRHKLADAFKHTSPSQEYCKEDALRAHERKSFASPLAHTFSPRPLYPPMDYGTPEQVAALASLRGLSCEGVALANECGLVRFGQFRGKATWFITDNSGRIAQARRMDGQPWADGVKAWTLAGSQAKWPVGIQETASIRPVIVFCEGGPDLLAACHFIVAEDRRTDCAPVGILGASCPIHLDALPLFNGKRVRIFPHLDESGQSAAIRWAEQLADAGAEVDAFSFARLRRSDDMPIKDFNDLAAVHADDFEHYRCLLSLFPTFTRV